ncbi:MAG: recombinase A [Acidobacteriota bacterium]|jgi:recombination protein RecA
MRRATILSTVPSLPAPAHRPAPAPDWGLSIFSGRVGELSGGCASAALTLAFRLVLEAQRAREPVAWISRPDRFFYPPDAAAAAVDLEALVVVRVEGALGAARAADRLVRSGAFGLVILDLGEDARLPLAALSRLSGLARVHRTAVLGLTEKDAASPSLGPLVSIRAEAARMLREPGRFVCRARVLKDKQGRPGREHEEVLRGPDGLH